MTNGTAMSLYFYLFTLLLHQAFVFSLLDLHKFFSRELWLCVHISAYGCRHSLLPSLAGPRFDTSLDFYPEFIQKLGRFSCH